MRRELLTFGLAGLMASAAWARPAAADCNTDIDCPGPTCGSPVCQRSVGGQACVVAGTDPQGFDGSCTTDADCKCRVQGATCLAATLHCSFTLPEDGGSSAGAVSADAATSPSGSDAGGPSASCAAAGARRGAAGAAAALVCAAALALARRRRRTDGWNAMPR